MISPTRKRPSSLLLWTVAPLLWLVGLDPAASTQRPRLRDLGVSPGILSPGPFNAITDVKGVRVGQRTLIQGDSIRTGVTVVLPHGGNLYQAKVPAAVFVGNGFGKSAGFLQVQELGVLETPIVLTNTLSVGTAIHAVVQWTLRQPGNEEVRSVNAVVGETNDGTLNDIRGLHVLAEDVLAAIDAATGGPVTEGNVGAGTGTMAMGWKGGIGTASRLLPATLGGYSVGALVQSNFGGILRIDGIPVGERLGRYSFRSALLSSPTAERSEDERGSCMVVLATDAPLDSRNLERLARRAILALGRVGSFMSNGSGDFVIAFSTAYRIPHTSRSPTESVQLLRNDATSPLFLAVVESVEEAIYNSLLQAEDMTGHLASSSRAISIESLRQLFAERKKGRRSEAD